MKIRCLSYNEVLDLYREQMNKYGGYCAIRDNNALLSVIANPQRIFAGRDLYPTISQKASILVYSMNKNHPFVEGNKRAAFICGRIFLRLNGYDVVSLEEYYKLIVKIAKGETSKDGVFEWFDLCVDKIANLKKRARRS